jgi:3-deoxy-D-manno-octulosonic acid (KDO) 8-phosphate synthase
MSLSPVEAIRIVEDVAAVGNWNVILTEMGTSLDGTLLVDFHGFAALKESGFPVVFDASSPRLGFSPALSAAGLAAGADGLLLTVTEDESSVQDPGACPMEHVPELLRRWKGIDVLLKKLR